MASKALEIHLDFTTVLYHLVLLDSSFIHKFLIHRDQISVAREAMVEYFLREPGPLQITPRAPNSPSQGILEHAMVVGDIIELVRTWVEMSNKSVSCSEDYVLWGALDRAALMLAAVETAAKCVFPWKMGLKMIDYASSIGCGYDAEVVGHKLPQPIHSVIEKHHDQLFNWMLEQSFNPNARDEDGNTCLHHLLKSGFSNLDRLNALLIKGAEPNAPDSGGVTLIHVALLLNLSAELMEMVRWGADVNQADMQGDTALHYVAKLGNTDLLNILLSHATLNFNLTNNEGQSALLIAASSSTNVVLGFVTAGVDTTIHDNLGRSCLHLAAAYGDPETVTKIIQTLQGRHQQLLNYRDHTGDTPLSSTLRLVSSGREEQRIKCCQLLLKAGSNPDDALHAAVETGSTRLVQLVLEFQPDLSYECSDKHIQWLRTTCLSKAAFYGNLSVVSLLLEAHGNLGRDSRNRTCLHYAFLGNCELLCRKRLTTVDMSFELSRLLTEHLVDMQNNLINAQDDQGRTALHVATLCNHRDLLRFLYLFEENNSKTEKPFQLSIDVKDTYGHTPLHYATVTGRLRESLLHQMLREFSGGAADEILQVSPLAVSIFVVPITLVCHLVSSGADSFAEAKDCECPFDLVGAFESMYVRSFIRALMTLNAKSGRGKLPPVGMVTA
jgi:ankyrin repeat protein